MRTKSIPILLITGFLGAGKTTLLNSILSNKQNVKIGVIVNDFGDINIDSLLVTSQTDKQLELSNGCICCSLADEDLDDAISQLAHKDSQLDYIIIEASGLAEPGDLATLLRLMQHRYSHFDGLVTVVDGLNFAKNNQTHASALQNLKIADIVVLSKVDLLDEQAVSEIEQGIKMVAPLARILRSSGQVDPRLLLDQIEKPQAEQQLTLAEASNDDPKPHLHDTFSSVSFTTKEPLDPANFERWSKNLPTNVFRSKGICYFGIKGVEQKFIFQSVGNKSQLKLDEWQPGESIESSLVVIGTELNKTEIESQLQALVDQNPYELNDQTLMDIYRYK